jgi:hypothetical protein
MFSTITILQTRRGSMLKNGMKGLLLVILMVAMGGASPLNAQDIPDPEGHWEGTIQTPGTGFGFNVDFMEDGGTWTGDISIPDQMLADFALGGITIEGTSVNFAMTGIPGPPSFTGVLSGDGQTLSGTFTQGEASFPFRLTRSD